jgi:RimJ/RimL family protein N-acetyltransferase
MNREKKGPTLETERLLMRPFTLTDVPMVAKLANDKRVADTLGGMPHPYSEKDAREWIEKHEDFFEERGTCCFAITCKESGEFMGSMSVRPSADRLRADCGYWLGHRYWGKGFATEALRELIRFSFEELGVMRVSATHFPHNPASGRVMEKAGMKLEGRMRLGISKFGELHDAMLRAIVRPDWDRSKGDELTCV